MSNFTRPSLTSRPRIIGANSAKYVGKLVTIIGEVTSVSPQANTIAIRQPDDDNMIVFLPKNGVNSPIQLHLLTEVSGKLVSRGQLDATWVKQFDAKQTAIFNKQLYVEAAHIMDAQRRHLDV